MSPLVREQNRHILGYYDKEGDPCLDCGQIATLDGVCPGRPHPLSDDGTCTIEGCACVERRNVALIEPT